MYQQKNNLYSGQQMYETQGQSPFQPIGTPYFQPLPSFPVLALPNYISPYTLGQTKIEIVERLKSMNAKYWSTKDFEFYYLDDQNQLYIFQIKDSFKTFKTAKIFISNSLTINPPNIVDLHNGIGVVITNFKILNEFCDDVKIIEFCEHMKSKMIFTSLGRDNFRLTNYGVFIKNTDIILPKIPYLSQIVSGKCLSFHEIQQDFRGGLYSEDKLFYCPTCQKHYRKDEVNLSLLENILLEVK